MWENINALEKAVTLSLDFIRVSFLIAKGLKYRTSWLFYVNTDLSLTQHLISFDVIDFLSSSKSEPLRMTALILGAITQLTSTAGVNCPKKPFAILRVLCGLHPLLSLVKRLGQAIKLFRFKAQQLLTTLS